LAGFSPAMYQERDGTLQPDPALLASLEAAVSASSDDVRLRVHLAALLAAAGRPADALAHAQQALAREPLDLDALTLAAAAADATGLPDRAEQYRTIHAALVHGKVSDAGRTPADEPSSPAEGAAPPREAPDPAAAPGEAAVPPHPLPRPMPRQPTAPGNPDEPVPLSVLSGGGPTDDGDVETPQVTLDDVAGMEDVKRRLTTAFLAPMRNPQMRALYGKSLRGGLLLYGPPGCGKTHIARATAGELGARFLSVGLADVLDMWLGQSERNLHGLLEQARRHAPCVLFLDEVDAIGQKRSLLRHSAGRGVVAQLLSEMDSMISDNEGVFVLAATNAPWDVDSALRRPGRFDRTLLVLPPDRIARAHILDLNLRDRPLDGGIDAGAIAGRTEGYSGADMAHICETAAEYAMDDSLQSGTVRPIGQRDLERALAEVSPSTRPWFESARNFVMFANEGGMYDDLVDHMRKRRLV
jgi:AAA+ superfamily predicted ATPase